MDIRRVILFAALAFVGYSLWMDWQKEYPPMTTKVASVSQQTTEMSNGHLMSPMDMNASSQADTAITEVQSDAATTPATAQIIHVRSDVLDFAIDLKDGDVVNAQLMQYPESTENKDKPFVLLQNDPQERYVANSNLFVVDQQKIKPLDVTYQASNTEYQLLSNQNSMVVRLEGNSADGLSVVKQFTVTKGSYLIQVNYELTNTTDTPWKGYMNTQLLRSSPKEDKSSMFHVGSYTGASFSQPGVHKFKKVSFKDMGKSNLDVTADGGWLAMQQHYFLSAWIPNQNEKNRLYTRATQQDFTIGAISQPVTINSNQTQSIGAQLYVGPEDSRVLQKIAPGLDLTVDYGWLWFISSLLFSLMSNIYSVVGNWGWSIVLVTVLIKLGFYKLSATSYKSMANMRRLQPKLAALRERYGDDKAKMSQATMEFYRQEKVNPLGGCLPILVQIPVFIALYWVLIESVQLRQAPFILWINDLAAPDPYHVLPIIMGITMLIQQKLNPAPPDPTQAKIMMFLPVFFTALFWGFPSGLVLYWIVNNTLSILQQWYITQKYSSEPKPKRLPAKGK